jgi:hypothetical protein
MKRLLTLSGFILLLLQLQPHPSAAVSMANDPKGFEHITWGSALQSRTDLKVTREGDHVTEYQFKETAPSFAGIPVDSIRLSTVDEQFARVTIRYQGEKTHRQIMQYLEERFGAIERIPGQMMRGLNQQYNWRGSDSEINLTYQGSTERGFIFLDSRTLAPRFNDQMTDSAE